MDDPAPRLTAEQWLARVFADGRPRHFGTGWLSGVLGIVLALLALLSVLCWHFPQYLTLPELRERYPLALVRLAIDIGLLAAMGLAGLSMLLRKRKALGVTALILAGAALTLGAGGAEIPRAGSSVIYLGLDWFVLGVLSTAAILVPLEGAFPLRRGQGAFRRGWLTDTQYFFASHALAQLMSVAVLAPAVALGEMLAVPSAQAAVQSLPWLVQFALCVLVADLAQYGVHRAFHAIPLLWRFHKVHHSVETMDWLAGSRLHLVDVIVTRGLVLLALLVAGFAETALYAYLALVSFHAVFIHANFAPRSRWLERWVAMPRFHHWHHGVEPEARDVNFAVHLPVIDRWFGTYHLPEGRWPGGYGIAGERAPEGWVKQLVWPFSMRQ
ncbi:sterol desaturase family protein [Erythrobacter tepidarius]|uniref:sterol desaturase family protein n=1 Tax=Erythrobacter tepidarius TaxID=60454 RepID=UPI001302BB48|nr:sterol desaturase family protein [Erythrobacter tepidarius]